MTTDDQEREHLLNLQNLLFEGLASGEDILLTNGFWKDLRKQAVREVKARPTTMISAKPRFERNV